MAILVGQAVQLAGAPAVELLRDPWGTPHVFAASEADGFFGLGYAAAEDRLLQMELIRRKAAGRLAEVFGPDWVDADREARIASHAPYAPRAFANLPARWQDALRAYAAGVNAWRLAHPELVARRFKPGERFTWEGYEFTVDWMPGQTEFALCQAAPDASPGVHLVAFDVTLDGQRYGERFDLIVGVEPAPVALRRDVRSQ